MIKAIALLSALTAFGATPTRNPPPLVRASWKGAPEGFHTTEFHTHWEWVETVPHELGPTAVVHSEAIISVPAGWQFKSSRAGLVKISSVTRAPGAPGRWAIAAEQNVLEGSADLDFLDEHDKAHRLTLRLRSGNRYPYLLTKTPCEQYDIRLDPGVATAHYLYLIQNCAEFGDDVLLYFARSPDGRWVPSPEIKSPKAISFEYRFPKHPAAMAGSPEAAEDAERLTPRSSGERHIFTLHTEDSGGRRAEWDVVAIER